VTVGEFIADSTTASTSNNLRMELAAVTPTEGIKKGENSTVSQADDVAGTKNVRHAKAEEPEYAIIEQKRGNASSTVASLQSLHMRERVMGKGKAQSSSAVSESNRTTPKEEREHARSPVTGLTPDDPAYLDGTNAVTESIVKLERESETEE